MIQVYHDKNPTFFVRDGFVPNVMRDFAHVANVATFDKDVAFQLTNTIYKEWWTNEGVTFLGSPDHGMDGCRLTSVGDVLVLSDDNGVTYKTFLVMSCGFKEVVVK